MFNTTLVILIQVTLLILYYGHATLLGITWATLPWWVVWLPFLCVGGFMVGLGLFLLVCIMAACIYG